MKKAFNNYFDKYDLNKDGFLEKSEIVSYFKEGLKNRRYSASEVDVLA